MPATTRYSATFDRPYEEDDRPEPLGPPLQRRSRSMSLQTTPSLINGRPYAGLGSGNSQQRSSSTDNGLEQIPTRTAGKAAVKAHSNPFQFVKVGTCSLYKKAEDQLKKVKEVKKPEVLQEEEEEWQSNLDSWKTRRRKMSEDVFKRQEEIKQFEIEEQTNQAVQKKTKTFSEMLESRATRGRTLSLCLISSPLEFQDWQPSSKNCRKMSSVDNLLSGESEENSNVNSEDETGVYQNHDQNNIQNGNGTTKVNGTIHQNGNSRNSDHINYDKLPELQTQQPNISKDDQNSCGTFIDSGIESISSHRTSDIPDSGSDFSQDSTGSMDCESPRVADVTSLGISKLLQDFNSQSDQTKKLMPVKNEVCCSTNGVLQNGQEKKNAEKVVSVGKAANTLDKRTVNGTLHEKMPKNVDMKGLKSEKSSTKRDTQERSIESENEMYVDDFEELNGKVNHPLSVKSNSTTKQLPSIPKEDKIPELPPIVTKSVTSEAVPASSVSSSKTSDSSTTINDEDKLKSSDSKSKVSNEANKVVLVKKKIKGSTTKLNKKPVNIPKPTTSSQQELTTITNSKNSLNIIYQSHDEEKNKVIGSESMTNQPKLNMTPKPSLNVNVPSVEKVAEEMEKLILEQLEEEERSKEMAAEMKTKPCVGVAENVSVDSVGQLKPPNEKPPPPPSEENDTKVASSLNRVSSTKRIKKEIHKRRSNFLGIENGDENIVCDDSSIPPPPALKDILKAEMEIDREGRKQVENAATQRLIIEESEILRKEQEIIENLEIEERRKMYMGQTENEIDIKQSLTELNSKAEEERIQHLKQERKKAEEEQKVRLEEEKVLREREEYIRKQEGDKITELSSETLKSTATTSAPNAALPTSHSSTKPNTLLSEKGDGENSLSDSLSSKSENVQVKPIVPPKPLKKKELIRKERERLRQEQEALQREREEHRQKLLMEQELLKNAQKPHAPEGPVTRIGPPPPAKPTFNTQLTPLSALPLARENTAHTSRSHHGAQNGTIGNMNSDVKQSPGRSNKMASSRGKATQNDSFGQQKVPSVKKQNDSLTESRYNQNHWLIQEAEMRRIAELNERHSQAQLDSRVPPPQGSYSHAHLVEDDACSNLKASQRLPTAMPSAQGTSLNYKMSPLATANEQMWNYRQPINSNGQVMKYPAPVSGEKAHVHVSYPRKPVDPPTKPSRVVPMERQEQMLSVSGRKRCSHCNEELGRGAAMIIESLQLYYHIQCFQCCVCQAQLGNGSCGTDVRVRNNKLHCQNCYSNDEAGLKFSQV